jgi:predicted metalloendopeptidase
MEANPRHDFYKFVNETWLEETKVPHDAASTNISREIAEKIEGQLIEIVKDSLIQEPDSKLSKFVKSIYNTWDNPKQTEFVVAELIGALNMLENASNIGFMIGHLNRIQARSPLTVKIMSDSYNTKYTRVQLSEYVPCVPNRHLLLEEKYGKERDAYRRFLQDLGLYFGIAGLEKFVDLEIKIAKHLPTPMEEDDTPNRYHKLSYNKLKADYPETPWDSIFKGMGVPNAKLEDHDLIITNPKFFHFFNTMCGSHEEMKLWLMGCAVITMGRFISGDVYHHYFNFYGKVLKGVEKESNVDRIMMAIVTTHLPNMLSKPFVEKFVNKQIKEKATELVHILKRAGAKRIRAAQWLSLETQMKATLKLNKMGFKVGFPTVWRDESKGEEISDKQMLRNLFKINEKDTEYGIEEIGERGESARSQYWDSACFEVNAFYYPDYNEMIIPAGILNPPFYDPRKSIAWNLGGIGNVITHEITHGFDSDGRNHDEDGNYAPWWTEEENKEYEAKSKLIEQLFSVEYMGSQIDGKLTLMENIADLGGVSIALQALRDEMVGKTGVERNKMLKEFFTSYAVSWRNKDRKKKAELASKTDKHAPPELRVNKILSQFPEFYETYGLKPGDSLWVPPEKRVTIW